MTRTRIESLLASFPKLIPTNSQHTSVETSDVRYVYQPLEELYILLITNKASNILQDIETLHLFARVVSDMCRSADEKEILGSSFELLGAFDEIVSLGYREQVNLMQVRSVLEMESHEEKIQDIIARVSHISREPLFILSSRVRRTKRQKRKRSSNVVPSNSRCSVGINKGVQPVKGEVAILEAASPATLQSRSSDLNRSRPLSLVLRLLHRCLHVLPHSRVVV